ncbi:MAG: hypothetical protein ACRDNO_27815 [Trebonia sp.]
MRTAFAAATGAVAFAALTAACGSSAGTSSTQAATGAAASTQSSASTSAGTSKLTGAAATALVTKAIANTQAATSVRVAGSATAKASGAAGIGGQPVTFDLTLVKNVGCEGTLALSKTETFQLVETGGYVWLLPSSAFYQSLHLDKTVLALMADKYIKVKSTDSQIGDLGKECTFAGLLGALSKPTGKDYTAVPATYNGGPAYEVTQSGQQGMAFVTNTATPLLLKITDPQANGGTITFADYNATKTITAPTAAESIDGSQLGI